METVFSNLDATIFLCLVSHQQVAARLLAQESIAEVLPNSSSKKQLLRAAAKQQAFQHMTQLAGHRGLVESRGKFSVSHSTDNTVLLASYRPEVFSCGVDMETVDVSRRIRPFMRDYLARSSCARECSASPVLLSTILFCCMESMYKTLSAWRPMTFSVDDYYLTQITDNWCEFNYVGAHEEITSGVIRCRYYLREDTIVATTFINFQLISI